MICYIVLDGWIVACTYFPFLLTNTLGSIFLSPRSECGWKSLMVLITGVPPTTNLPRKRCDFRGDSRSVSINIFLFFFSIRNSLLTRRMTSILKLGPASMHRLILAVCGMKSWPRIGHLKPNDGTLYYISLDQGNRVEWPFEAVPRRVSADPDGSVQRDKVNWGIDVFKTLQNSAFSIQAE